MAYRAAISWGTLCLLYYNFQSLILRFFAGRGLSPQSAAFSFSKSIYPLCIFVKFFIFNSIIYLVLIVLSLLCLA